MIIQSIEYESLAFKGDKHKSDIALDWATTPLVDIIVTNDETCPSDYDLILYRPWLGTNLWCVCRYFGDNGYIKHIKSYEGDCVEPNRPDYGGECLQLDALHPVFMGQFMG